MVARVPSLAVLPAKAAAKGSTLQIGKFTSLTKLKDLLECIGCFSYPNGKALLFL
jgi:hypothetical protein